MIAGRQPLPDVLKHSPVRVVFEPGAIEQLGDLAAAEGASNVLVVTDPGIRAAGHVARAAESLGAAGLSTTVFDGARENPTEAHVQTGVAFASSHNIDFIVGLGGGSAMDCAKGINLVLTNGGQVKDYWGVNKTTSPMLPMIAIPTTAGTGSEAQSFALISDPVTHIKMACGDRRLPIEGGLRPRVAILDPELTRSVPRSVAASSGMDAVSHAIETVGTNIRNEVSIEFSIQAWSLLDSAFESAITGSHNDQARSQMLLGAHLAGAAIEHAMLGAAHACANPLTAMCNMVHGQAVGLLLPHVVRFNSEDGLQPYADLCSDVDTLIDRLSELLSVAKLPTRLADYGVPREMLPELAKLAAKQWTAQFNPRPVGPSELLDILERAY